jgi:hypothetical protein
MFTYFLKIEVNISLIREQAMMLKNSSDGKIHVHSFRQVGLTFILNFTSVNFVLE